MNKLVYSIIAILLVSVVAYLIFNKVKEGYTNKIVCKKNGCPNELYNNDLYKLHHQYEQLRVNNHMIAHNTDAVTKTTVGPANIFMIRHGEKVKTEFGLDCNGVLRSTYIPEMIQQLNDQGFGIHAIVTAYSYISMHKVQTVSLASWLLNIPIFMYGSVDDIELMVENIFKEPYFANKTILICWEHQCFQDVLKKLTKYAAKARNIPNYTFKNPEGNSQWPYWNTNNYKSIYYLDSDLNFSILEENFTTCYPLDNNEITYGKKQKCK
jgi:hypothetical protein